VRTGALVLAAVAAVAAGAIAGCGPQGDIVKSRPALAEIQPSPELGGTPAQAALAWWNTLRARDAEAAVSRLTPAARSTIDLPELRQTLDDNFGNFAEHTVATVLYTERQRGRVTVFMRLEGGPLVGARVVREGVTLLALPLVSRDGAWLIENAAWLRKQAQNYVAIKKFNEKLKREVERQRQENGK
jgi:hypothetical protein